MTEVLLGIDCGSSVTKAALFDLDGHELAAAASRTGIVTLKNGGVERSTDGVWQSVVHAVRAAVADSGVRAVTVAGIGCSGHGNGLYALDADGDALPTAYLSMDTRADALVREWIEQGYAEVLFQDGWQRPWAGQPLAILGWLRRHDPDTYAAIATILLCKDFVNHRLTGRAVTDLTDMSAAGLLGNAAKGYDERLFSIVGLEAIAVKLPELVVSTRVIGTLSDDAAAELGLSAGTPVVGGLFDVAGCAIGSGGAAPGCLSLVAGTWSIATVVTREPLIDTSILMTTAFADGERWMSTEASATSAINLDWFVKEAFVDGADTGEGTVFDRCCRVAGSASMRSSSPLYHPFLHGAPMNPHARAGFYGISGSHTRADLARAVLEGVAFGSRAHVANLISAGATPERARLTGGGARSEVWSQMFADVLAMPIEIPDAQEAGARGAALAAGVGIGAYPGIDEAMARATRVASTHEPNADLADLYTERYGTYREIIAAMEPVWRTMAVV